MPVIDLGKNILVQVIDKLREQEAEENFYDFKGIVMRKKKMGSSFNNSLLSISYMPDTVRGTEDTIGNNTKIPALGEACILVESTNKKQNKDIESIAC